MSKEKHVEMLIMNCDNEFEIAWNQLCEDIIITDAGKFEIYTASQ